MASKKVITWPAGRPYLAGDAYSFHTSPATEFSPSDTRRYAAIRIIGSKNDAICVAVLDGVFDQHPVLSDVRHLSVIKSRRFRFQGDPACCFVGIDYENFLQDIRYVGSCGVSQADADLLAECRSYSDWTWASAVAEGEWRWKHDRAAYEEEVRRKEEALLARVAAERDRQKTRLRSLTWEALLREKLFSRWERHLRDGPGASSPGLQTEKASSPCHTQVLRRVVQRKRLGIRWRDRDGGARRHLCRSRRAGGRCAPKGTDF